MRARRPEGRSGVVFAVQTATDPHSVNRADSAMAWFNLLEEEITRPPPEPDTPSIDPYHAKRGDVLEGELEVVSDLGNGSTARAIQVRGKDRTYAIKVPHDDSHVERLQAEAQVLEQIRHQHIVESHGMRHIGGRDCLLLSFAAERARHHRHQALGRLHVRQAAVCAPSRGFP